ncbi:hypothetical protein J7L67_07300 [bacterium]|nr:hypothetical protein [bacterium]
MDTQNSSNRRRWWRILIDKPLQLRYTSLIVALVVLYSGCLGYSLYTNSRETSRLMLEIVESNPKLEAKLSTIDNTALIKTIIAMLINAIVISYIGIFSTHKIAGPIYRFKKHLKSIKNGDFSAKTKLRKNDLLTELADDFNQASESLQNFINDDITKSNYFLKSLKELNSAIETNKTNPQEVYSAIKDITEEIDKYVTEKKKLISLKNG